MEFQLHDAVVKEGGDYYFEGIIVARFRKLSGKWRVIVEDGRGLLFIFNEKQLKLKENEDV